MGIIGFCFGSGCVLYTVWWFKREDDDKLLLSEEAAPWWVHPCYRIRRMLPFADKHTPKRFKERQPFAGFVSHGLVQLGLTRLATEGPEGPEVAAIPHQLGPRTPPRKPKKKIRPFSLTESLMGDSPEQLLLPRQITIPKRTSILKRDSILKRNSQRRSVRFADDQDPFGPDVETGEGPSQPKPVHEGNKLTLGEDDFELRELNRTNTLPQLEGRADLDTNKEVSPVPEGHYIVEGKGKQRAGTPPTLVYDPIRARAIRLQKQRDEEREKQERAEAEERRREEDDEERRENAFNEIWRK